MSSNESYTVRIIRWDGEDHLSTANSKSQESLYRNDHCCRESLLFHMNGVNILCDCPFNWELLIHSDACKHVPHSAYNDSTVGSAHPRDVVSYWIPAFAKLPLEIHVILITCTVGLLGLPYLAQCIDLTSTPIFCTCPVLTAAFPFLCSHRSSDGRPPIQIAPVASSLTPLPPLPLELVPSTTFLEENWKYAGAAEVAFPSPPVLHVQTVSYGEIVAFNPPFTGCSYTYTPLTFSPHSSGYSLGSAYWTVTSPINKRVCLIGPSCFEKNRYPRPFHWDELDKADVLCVYNVGKATSTLVTPSFDAYAAIEKTAEPIASVEDSFTKSVPPHKHSSGPASLSRFNQTVDSICGKILTTIKARGNVLIPIDEWGETLLELLEILHEAVLKQLPLTHQVPMYVLAEGVRRFINVLDSYSEWVEPVRLAKTMSLNPESAFKFTEFISGNTVHLCETIDELKAVYREPCILFATPASLKANDSFMILSEWQQHPKNLLVMVHPFVDLSNAILNDSNIRSQERMKKGIASFRYPIDLRMSAICVFKLLKRHPFPVVCLDETVVAALSAMEAETDISYIRKPPFSQILLNNKTQIYGIQANMAKTLLVNNDALDRCGATGYFPAKLSENEAQKLNFVDLHTLHGDTFTNVRITQAKSLTLRSSENEGVAVDHVEIVDPPSTPQNRAFSLMDAAANKLPFGSVDVDTFMLSLKKRNIEAVRIDNTVKPTVLDNGRYVVKIPAWNAAVNFVSPSFTEIECPNRGRRTILKECLEEQLTWL